jgi:hypothetical protein
VENGGGLAQTVAEDVILMQAGLDPREGGSVSMAWRIRKKSREAKTVVGRNELGGDAVQSGQGGVSSCASRGVQSTRLWHRMCVGRGSLTCEQENPRVHREVDIANPFSSIVLSQGSTTSSSPYLR